jgi:RNA polymerase sporulation-specific sigma factor
VEQEALIGLYKAARDFRPEHQSSFRAFAELCITRQIITAIKTATRQKHQALNQYVSISGSRTGDDAGERAVEELIHADRKGDDPPTGWWPPSASTPCGRLAEVLSDLEVDVLTPLRRGQELPGDRRPARRHVKSIDNALQRIKRKLEVHLAERADLDHEEDLALIAVAKVRRGEPAPLTPGVARRRASDDGRRGAVTR